jgi:hypothetical protein
MRKIAVLLVAFFFAFSANAFAADRAAEPNAPAVKKSVKSKKRHYQKNHFAGEVTFIDAEGGKIKVVGKKGAKTFKAEQSLLNEVKPGDRVFVKYTTKNKTFVATAINPADEKRHYSGMHMSGEVTAIDVSAETITILGRKSESTLTAERQLLADIRIGDRVYVKYTDADGKLTVNSIKPKKKLKSRTGDETKTEDSK